MMHGTTNIKLITSIIMWLWDKAVGSYNIQHLRSLWQSCWGLKSSMVQHCVSGPSNMASHIRKLESSNFKKYGVLKLISELWINFFDCLLLLNGIPNVSPCFILKWYISHIITTLALFAWYDFCAHCFYCKISSQFNFVYVFNMYIHE